MINLPPLSAIRAFEAASRHMSFTKAGAELGLTQAAVSYQIKLLEEKLGFAVFERKTRKIPSTHPGPQSDLWRCVGYSLLATETFAVRDC